MTKKVELHCAYLWTCDSCGRDNFLRAIVCEMTQEDITAMMEEHGGEPEDWKTGEWMTRPDEVTCEHCGAEYETEEWKGPTRP